jgi:hypothetical protein
MNREKAVGHIQQECDKYRLFQRERKADEAARGGDPLMVSPNWNQTPFLTILSKKAAYEL